MEAQSNKSVNSSYSLGQWGEKSAVNFLSIKQYKILETNWRFQKKEVDIIALKDNTIHIVEVKTRSSSAYGTPEEAVDFAKEDHLLKAGEAYLDEQNLDYELQFDIIAIVKQPYRTQLVFWEDAFGGF